MPAADPGWTAPPYYDLYPEYLPYEKGQPVPAGYIVEKNNQTWALVTGSAVVGAFYTYGLFAVHYRNDASWLFLPVVGPLGLMAARSNHCNPKCFGMEQSALIVDAVAQSAGTALFIWALATRGQRLVREDIARPRALFVTPVTIGSGYGVGAVGSF